MRSGANNGNKNRIRQLWREVRAFRFSNLRPPDWVHLPEYVHVASRTSRTLLISIWIYGYFVRWFTITGRLILIAATLIAFYSLILTQTPVLVLTFTLFSIFIVDFCVGFLFRPKLAVTRSVPERVRDGSDFIITYRVRNRRRRPLWNFTLDDVHFREGLRRIGNPASLAYLPPRGEATLTVTLNASRRGRRPLPFPLVESAFPLHVFKWSQRTKTAQRLLVYPRYEPLRSLDLPVGRKYQREGASLISKVGESLDLLGCRQYRLGDDPKHIHWPSTARVGELIVREYQQDYLTRIALIMDTFTPPPTRWRRLFQPATQSKPLEAAVSLTAAVADFLSRGDYVVDIFAAGPEVFHLKSGRSLDNLDHILDILACVEPNHDQPVVDLSPVIMEEFSNIGGALVILLKWDEERDALIRRLRDNGVAVKSVLLDLECASPETVARLDPDDVATGKVTVL